MWFLSSGKVRRTSSAGPKRGAFRPRLEVLEDRCLLSAGALDTTFGNNGLVTGPSSQATYTALPATDVSAVVVQPNGKILTGGYLTTVNRHGSISDFALVRYNANGSLDTAFGNNGVVQTMVGVNNSYINGIALQSNGDIVAVGQAVDLVKIGKQYHYDPAFAVARYLPTGALDTSFGSGGIVLTNVESDQVYSNTAGAFAVAIDGSGNIDVAGTANPSSTVNAGDEFALARYLPTGILDTTFGSGGMVVTPQFVANQPDQAFTLTIQSNGYIVLAGTTGDPVGKSGTTPWAMAVVRYTSAGVLDNQFNGTGIVAGLAPAGYYTRAHGVLVQSNSGGDIVVAGNSFLANTTSEYQTLARLTSAGQVDGSFGSSGYAINMNLYGAYALAQAADGDLLAVSATPLNASPPARTFGVAAFLPSNGAPDTTFGIGGTAYADFSSLGFSSGGSYDTALAVQPDGKLVVAGYILPPGSSTFTTALARFLPPNTKIGSFSGLSAGGSVTLSASNIMNSYPTSTISQVNFYLQNPDLSLTLVGTGTDNNGTWTFTFSETTYGLTSGNAYTFVAQAVDSNGVFSDPVTVSFQVM